MIKLNKKKIPQKCGVYFFRDKRGRILYIGKAVNLKNRLASYFKSQPSGRTTKLMEEATKVNWQENNSETEALIFESQLIKKYKPPFNIMLRDDKQYFYVAFDNDPFPRVFITHRPIFFSKSKFSIFNFQFSNKSQIQSSKQKPETRNPEGEQVPYGAGQKLETNFIGPFTDGSALKTTLRLLRRIFPYCTCKQKHNNFCLNYHIGKCLGFCCLKQQNPNRQQSILNIQQKNKYRRNIKAIKDILSGKRVSLIEKLKKEMTDLGKAGKFEEAIGLRDKIEKLEKVFENAQILRDTNTRMHTNYTNKTILKKTKQVLGLSRIPYRIEGYDVSNIQGKFAVGAMAVFTDGKPDKKEYRKFKIRSNVQIFRHRKTRGLAMTLNQKSNDTAMLKEVLTRRFNHPEWPSPDLIIIDGGKAQLNVAVKVISGHRETRGLAITKSSIPIIALTKNKRHRGSHIYLWSSQDHRLKEAIIPLKKLPEEVKNLILQVDTEAHRFAISYYRKLHRRLN